LLFSQKKNSFLNTRNFSEQSEYNFILQLDKITASDFQTTKENNKKLEEDTQ